MVGFKALATITILVLSQSLPSNALPSGLSERALPRVDERAPPLTRHLAVQRLRTGDLQTFADLLQREVEFLGFDTSVVNPHVRSFRSVPSMASTVRLQMDRFPDRRQFIHLASNGEGSRVYAMPLFIPEFHQFKTTLGDFAGTGDTEGSQRAMVFGVTHPHPTSLTLYRGPTGGEPPKIELYGVLGFRNAATFHSRIELPLRDGRIAKTLRDILRY
ncbi:uncharacterized protein SRS1_10054 [Sporisorium reilianum f. sp. reilianum]|uniref:Uncharacterized protein n=1 Tax=Sporisorium reilianum f. sp. reilianum TaxID=72559 RepID=A0A2N8ULE2_9BASI|nr:uncharacterized protein SRS1_10054 [Sporisorium reilianum f. sp. reilianum]